MAIKLSFHAEFATSMEAGWKIPEWFRTEQFCGHLFKINGEWRKKRTLMDSLFWLRR